jgi:hypothetical protein
MFNDFLKTMKFLRKVDLYTGELDSAFDLTGRELSQQAWRIDSREGTTEKFEEISDLCFIQEYYFSLNTSSFSRDNDLRWAVYILVTHTILSFILGSHLFLTPSHVCLECPLPIL